MTISNSALSTLPIITSRLLETEDWLRYGFTRRVAGMGLADGNVSYSGGRDRTDAWVMRQRWLSPLGLDPDAIATTGQVHGSTVLPVDGIDRGRGARPGSAILGLADATMTQDAGPVLFSLHADCLPILLADPVQRVVAVVHAGWRGTVADIARLTVMAMTERYGSDPADLIAFLGPAVSGEHYEVGADVIEAWNQVERASPEAFWPGRKGRWQFDAVIANESRLLVAGLLPGSIERSGICTWRSAGDWFSHRAQGPTTGRFGAFIAIR